MSATHRSLLRLPNSIFADLVQEQPQYDNQLNEISVSSNHLTPTELQEQICTKLSNNLGGGGVFASSSNNGNVIGGGGNKGNSIGSIKTVGQLMRLAPPALLRVLDPLLTNGE